MLGDISGLDDYSRIALPLILGRFPTWGQFARVHEYAGGDFVEFEVPCPSQSVDTGLHVSTEDQELTIGFHTHHLHFTDYENRLGERQIHAGLDYAADIVDERVGVIAWYGKGQFVGSMSIELPHVGPLPAFLEGVERLAHLADSFAACERVTLRSWSGRYDRG